MARKLVQADKKWAAVLRVLQEGRTVDEERRRCGVTRQAFDRWIRIYLKAHPDADRRPKPEEAKAPPPPPETRDEYKALADNLGAPLVTAKEVEAAEAAGKPGMIDAAALKAAMEADGEVESPSPTPALYDDFRKTPPPPHQLSTSTVQEDMDTVESVGNQLLGLSARGLVFFFEMKAGVRLDKEAMSRIQELYVLTPTEKAGLKPASRHIARKLNEWIGSSETISLGVGGSTLVQGLWDRGRIIGEAVAQAIEKKIAAMSPEERAELEKRMNGGAA